MNVAVALGILVLLAVVVALISHPLLMARGSSPATDPERAELDAAREAKYGEIRDAELDFRTGKLSPEDFAVVEAGLRAEASEILRRLEELDAREKALDRP